MFEGAQVTVMVAELDRAVQFYTGVLGLALKSRYGDEYAEVQAPGLTIGLHPASAHGPQPGQGGSMSLGFAVDELEAAMADLRTKGVVFGSQIMADGPSRLAFFADPDQTPLYLWETAPNSQPRDG